MVRRRRNYQRTDIISTFFRLYAEPYPGTEDTRPGRRPKTYDKLFAYDEYLKDHLEQVNQKLSRWESTTMDPSLPQLVFVDGTFDDLAQEFAEYVRVGDEVKPLIESQQQDEVLKKLVIASTALNSVPEKEFTAAYNLLVYLVLQSKNANMFLSRVCDNLMKPITSSPSNGPGLALGALTNIFNMLEATNEIRFHVFTAIVKFVKQHGLFDYLKKFLPQLPTWVDQWDIDEDDTRKLYEEVAEAAWEAGDEE